MTLTNCNITINNVAKKAGVSLATVSRVLNNPEKVMSQTRNKVLKIIEELGFRPNSMARGLANKKSTIIGVIISDLSHDTLNNLFNGILDISIKYNYTIKIYSIMEDSEIREKASQIVNDNLDGIIFANEKLTDRSVIYFRNLVLKNKIPVVFANVSPQSDEVSTVHIDYIKAFSDLTYLFIAKNKKNIYFINQIENYALNNYKKRGYLKAIEEANLKPQILEASDDPIENYQIFLKIFKNNKPDAIVASSDDIAVSCLNAIRELGYKIPEDVEIAGAQNTKISLLARPTLTTIDLPAYDIGAVSMRTLIKLMDEKSGVIKTVLNFKIIKRKSTLE